MCWKIMQLKKLLLNFDLIKNIFPKRCLKNSDAPYNLIIFSMSFLWAEKSLFSTLVKIQVRLMYYFSNSWIYLPPRRLKIDQPLTMACSSSSFFTKLFYKTKIVELHESELFETWTKMEPNTKIYLGLVLPTVL